MAGVFQNELGLLVKSTGIKTTVPSLAAQQLFRNEGYSTLKEQMLDRMKKESRGTQSPLKNYGGDSKDEEE